MLVPAAADRKVEILSGQDALSNFNEKFTITSDKPEANGNRIMISPLRENRQDRFLTVFQVAEGNSAPLPVDFQELPEYYQVGIADRLVCMNKGTDLIKGDVMLDIQNNQPVNVTIMGLKPGFWSIKGPDGKTSSIDVIQDKNTLNFNATAGKYTITYGRSY
jgi:heparin/heparan-sulfate lyase